MMREYERVRNAQSVLPVPPVPLTEAQYADYKSLMDRADFVGTNLENANLSGVIASGSSFADASITGADFSNALLDREDQVRLCRRAKGVNPTSGISTKESLDCR